MGPYSFYGVQPEQFDHKMIKTRMAMGGIEITLDAEKMMGLMNLKPHLSLEDCGPRLNLNTLPAEEQDVGLVHEHENEQGGRSKEDIPHEKHQTFSTNPFQNNTVANQNIAADDDSEEEELIDDLLKDV